MSLSVRWVSGVSVALLMSSCMPSQSVRNRSHPAVRAATNGLAQSGDQPQTGPSIEARVDAIEGALTLLACGPELRTMLRDLREECRESCDESQLKVVLRDAKEKFAVRSIGEKLLTLLRHEVVYISVPTAEIASERQKRLREFIAERRLPSTRYVLITAPLPTRTAGEERALAVSRWLTNNGLSEPESLADVGASPRPDHRIEPPWPYKLDIKPFMLKPVDRPVPPEHPDYERAVFVLRTDCL